VNCSKGVIDIVDVTGTSITIQNLGFIDLTGNFSVACGAESETTPSIPLTQGRMYTLSLSIDCTGDKVRVTSSKCPSVWAECTDGQTC
jgi:hypothetical protein